MFIACVAAQILFAPEERDVHYMRLLKELFLPENISAINIQPLRGLSLIRCDRIPG